MKKIINFILLFTFFSITNLFSQNIQLILSPNPSPYFSDWQNHSETAILIINNTSGASVNCKIKTQLFNGNGNLVGETQTDKMPIITILQGISQYNAEDIYPLQALKWYGASINSMITTGRIPEDNYRLCTQLVNPTTGNPLTAQPPECKMFIIVSYQAPYLISPRNNSTLAESDAKGVIFRWTPVTPSPNYIVTYRLQICEVYAEQDNATALRNNQPIVEKDFKGLLQTQWPVDFAMPEAGMNYVWTITPLDNQDRNLVEGYGFAQPNGFSINQEGNLKSLSIERPPLKTKTVKTSGNPKSITTTTDSTTANNSTDTTNTADSTALLGSGTAAISDTIRAGLNGEFLVIVSNVSTETDGSLTGKGTVYVAWLKTTIAVEFKKIRIDSTKHLTSGGIVSTQRDTSTTSAYAYPLAWGESWFMGPWVANKVDGIMNWTNNIVNNQINWVNNNINVVPNITYQSNIAAPAVPSNPLKMPFGLQFNSGNDLLVITEFIFKPNESKVNFLAQTKFAKSNIVYKLGFAGKYFKIHPNNIDFSNGRVELVEDIKLPNVTSEPKMKFTFKKGTSNSGCYIQWANSGITDMNLGMEVKFTRDWLLPIPTSPDSVIATFTGNASNMNDILLTGSLPACEIVAARGMKTQQALTITLDYSDIRNPSNIVFPKNYPDSSGVDWQGLYIKTFSLIMSDNWRSGTNTTAPVINASNIIIDDFGLTTDIKVANVLNLQTGKVCELSASLDTLIISIVSSSLVNGKALGKIILPISDTSVQNTLKYTLSFAQANIGNTYQMVIVPTQPIKCDILRGSMTLNATSNITATKTPTLLSFSMILNGVFKWDHPDLAAPVIPIINSPSTRALGIKGVKMELEFENFGFTYKNYLASNVDSSKFSIGNWSFASPQKFLLNFPITIKNFQYKLLPTDATSDPDVKELVRGALMIDIIANLTDDIGGATRIGAVFAIERNKTNNKFTPKYKGVFIDSIAVHADLAAVKISGNLSMYDNDTVFGDGFKANLKVVFTAVSLQIDALAQFGSTTYNNNNQFYRYWRVEADVKLPVGIPFLTGVGFYGFGGGAFYNMKANIINSIADPGNTAYTFEPKKSALGFMVKATIGTLPKFETFNADVSLMALFNNTTGGLTEISFLGDFWLAAKLTERDASKIKGSVIVDYVFPDKLFFMAAELSINVPDVITTPSPIGFSMSINGRTNLWYFKCGIPDNLNEVIVFNISLYSYLMFGNNIPQPQGFTTRFSNKYHSATGEYPTNSNVVGGVGVGTSTGKGFATGIGIEFVKDAHQDLYRGQCRQWSIGGDIKAGAELNLALMQVDGCIGINGYRASGSLGLYASINATINGTSFSNFCRSKSISLFNIKTGAWLQGQFPNPEFIAGNLHADIQLFNGLCSWTYNRYFERGTNCFGTEVVTANAAQEDKAGDLKNKLIQYIAPNTHYSFPVTSPVNVKYALVPDQVFDIAENQGDGTIKNRTFKLVITTSLEVKNINGIWTAQMLKSKLNNMGEYQYCIKLPISTTYTQGTTQMIQTGINVSLNNENPINLNNFNAASSNNRISVNNNSGNNLISTNGNIRNNSIPGTIPPPPGPDYPNPVLPPTNSLTADMDYRFIVTATLMEYSINHIPGPGGRGEGTDMLSWAPAKTRLNTTVTETRTFVFRTGLMQMVNVNSTTPSSR